MLEYTACKRYYDHTQRAKLEKVTASYADHDNCKAQPVHSGFIFLMTALAVATEAICLLSQFLVGNFADRRGMRTALCLSLSSTVCYWAWIAVSGKD